MIESKLQPSVAVVTWLGQPFLVYVVLLVAWKYGVDYARSDWIKAIKHVFLELVG